MPKPILGIRPTRIELLKLRRRELIAKKGHDILQEKLDAMVIQYQRVSSDLITLEEEIQKKCNEAYNTLKQAGIYCGFENLDEISSATKKIPDIVMGISQMAGVKIPKIEFKKDLSAMDRGYSFTGTCGLIDEAGQKFEVLLSLLIRYAEIFGTAQSLSEEITSCRRRVNALAELVIHSLIQTERYIEMRLEEREREDLFRRKRTKHLLNREERGE